MNEFNNFFTSTTSYVVLQKLGSGKNAVVDLVLATSGMHSGLLFAVKVFEGRTESPESRSRFLEERQFLESVNHPAIMRQFDRGRMGDEQLGKPFVVVEYLPTTLRTAMNRGLPLAEKVCFVLQLLSALQFLESQTPKRVHCDIKPENIFIKGRSCVLGDFGLMRAEEPNPTGVRTEPPMPRNYRTPDLVSFGLGESGLSTKSDLFQLGLVVAELFSGRNPLRPIHDGESKLVDLELDELGSILGGQGSTIRNSIRGMLESNPDRRTSLDDLFFQWRGILASVVDYSRTLDGELFPSWLAAR